MAQGKKQRKKKSRQNQNSKIASKHLSSSKARINSSRFRWKTTIADLDGEWGWNKIEIKLLFREIIPKLQNYETMTWGEIEGKDSHFIGVGKCSKEARKRLEELELDDLEELFSLRMSGRRRIWGRLQSSIFDILWWDPEHQVYPIEKKHT